MAYWQLPAFFPKFLKERKIDEAYTGFCMSSFAAGLLIFSFITGKCILSCMKRINGAFLGASLTCLNLLGMGTIYYIEDKEVIKIAALVL